jgi:hypothetical protein
MELLRGLRDRQLPSQHLGSSPRITHAACDGVAIRLAK